MTTFSDPEHALQDLAFQGADEQPIKTLVDDTVLLALIQWEARTDQSHPLVERFQFGDTRTFTISYQGESGNFWPDRSVNILGETLVREFLFSDGICKLEDMTPKLYNVKYRVEAMDDNEYLLVCPYPTASNNTAGLLVVCVNEHLKQKN